MSNFYLCNLILYWTIFCASSQLSYFENRVKFDICIKKTSYYLILIPLFLLKRIICKHLALFWHRSCFVSYYSARILLIKKIFYVKRTAFKKWPRELITITWRTFIITMNTPIVNNIPIVQWSNEERATLSKVQMNIFEEKLKRINVGTIIGQ